VRQYCVAKYFGTDCRVNNKTYAKEECTYTKDYLSHRKLYVYPVVCTKNVGGITYNKKTYGLHDTYWKVVHPPKLPAQHSHQDTSMFLFRQPRIICPEFVRESPPHCRNGPHILPWILPHKDVHTVDP